MVNIMLMLIILMVNINYFSVRCSLFYLVQKLPKGVIFEPEKQKKKQTVFWVRSAIQLWFLAQIAQKTHLGHKSVNRPLFGG